MIEEVAMRAVVAACLAALCAPTAFAASPSPARIRDAAARGIQALQQSQKGWYAKQRCESCHHQFQPAIALRSARDHGIPFDEAVARADAERAFDYSDFDRAVQYTHVIEPAMSDGYRLVAANAAGVHPSLVTAIYARHVAAHQNPDGAWDNFRQRPPASYSQFTMTALALRGVQLYSHPSQKADVAARTRRARRWFETHAPRDTEERTYQLFGLSWAGANRATIERAARDLAAAQQADGGWSSLGGRASDVYSTAEALVALHDVAGQQPSSVAWRRGIEFVLDAQAPDGSWHVTSRMHPPAPISPPYFESGYPYGHDQFISASGASWAITALARALEPASNASASIVTATEPTAMEPWAETVLFGSVAELKKLLDDGLDPNAATKTGGTTVLMMAAPDVAKMTLLVDRGANINARASTQYSALMVAAQYPHAAPAIHLLLDRGAEVRLDPSVGTATFGAYPLFLAAYSGNAEVLKRLRAAGDSLTDGVTLLGARPSAPLSGAIKLGHVDVVRALLDLGAPIEQPEQGGLTPLARAVLNNRVDIARLLISRGADVNHVDNLGMTPLLYAASIDFGDGDMIELLLKSGARADARTREGLTALDLARQYQHAHLLGALQGRTTH
jgi:ankyrin repeat protein